MSGHTPGPWGWFSSLDAKGNPRKNKRKGMRYLFGSDGQGFAHTVGLNPETDIANAQLIAAAPDLLEAAQTLIEGFDTHGNADEAYNALRTAIAKATGAQ